MSENKKVIKVGDIFFVSSRLLSMFTIEDDYVLSHGGFFGERIRELDKKIINSREKNGKNGCIGAEDELLFAVKYLGNGTVEEMVTGLKLQIESINNVEVITDKTYTNEFVGTVKFKTDDCAATFEDSDNLSISNIYYLNYNEYKGREIADEGYDYVTKGGFAKLLLELIYRASNYPIQISCDGEGIYTVNDQSIGKYLRDSDSTRNKYIKLLLEEAKKDYSTELFPVLNEILKKNGFGNGKLPKALLNEAYLANQFYEFKHRGNTR